MNRRFWFLAGPLAMLLAVPALAQQSSGKDCAVCHLEWVDSFKQPTGVLLMDPPLKPVVSASDTCLGCHDGSVADSRRVVWIEHGHRTGVKPSAGMLVPENLPLEDGKLACRTCHTAHTSGFGQSLKDAVFLRVKNDNSQLCKSCHTDKAKGPKAGSHPLAKMKTPFPASLIAAGAHAGPDNDTVVCQSCHTAHGARQDHLMLMANNASQICLTCHQSMRPAMWDKDAAHEHPQSPLITDASQIKAIKDMGTQLGPGNHLVCLSCHKVHDGHSGRAMLADTLQDSALCIRCHEDRKTLFGSDHDLRKSAPASVNLAGETPTQSGPCGACHSFHTYSRKPTPQVADPQGLCTTCHSEGQVAAKHTGKLFHPSELRPDHIPANLKLTLYPSLNDPTRKAVACLSCHNPHDTKHPHFLRTTGDQLCGSCHSEYAQSLSRPHDFTGKPNLRNALGRSPAETGKCGFCHSVHEAKGPMMWVATNQPFKTMDDACTQCHSQQGIGHDKPVAMFNHPTGPDVRPKDAGPGMKLPLFNASFHSDTTGSVACSSCHDVHLGARKSKDLLRAATPTQLCVQCHNTQSKMAGGLHDPKTCKEPFPAAAAKSNDLCLSCHQPHSNDPARERWTIAPVADQLASDGSCEACHKAEGWSSAEKASESGPMLHSRNFVVRQDIHNNNHLPLAKATAADQPEKLICKTCHDPHAPPGTTGLLRINTTQTATDLCGKCHAEATYLQKTMHNQKSLARFVTTQRGCAPCHSVHALPGENRELLWAARSMPQPATAAEQLCLGCHDGKPDGAPRPEVFTHPQTTLKDLATATTRPSTIIDHFGKINQITCATCHIPHGHDIPAPTTTSDSASLAQAKIAGIRAMLRPNIDREVCAACHGIDGARMYLYYHNARKRQEAKRLIEGQ